MVACDRIGNEMLRQSPREGGIIKLSWGIINFNCNTFPTDSYMQDIRLLLLISTGKTTRINVN
jgi:hypothetical protein